MPRMPGTRWQGEHGSSLMSRYDVVCMHTIVGYAPAHQAHFSVHGDGSIDQSRDTMFRSAANLDGNYRVIAIENEDHGPPFPEWSGSDVPRLTDAQVEANARILLWAHETHGVPLVLCPDSKPSSRGLAYHRQGIDGNFTTYPGRVPGGEVWTLYEGKVCPGDRRIAQRPDVLAAAIALDNPAPSNPKTGDDDVFFSLVRDDWEGFFHLHGAKIIQCSGASFVDGIKKNPNLYGGVVDEPTFAAYKKAFGEPIR